jgi:signal transduction histidine kinase
VSPASIPVDGEWQEARSLLRFVVNSLPIVVYAFDADGTVLLAEGEALTGMASASGAAVGRCVFEVFEGEPEAQDHLRRALDGDEHTATIRLRRNDRIYRVWYRPWRDAVGKVGIVTGLSLDVTEARQTDRELRAAITWLETIQDHVPIGIFRLDASGTITLARGSILPDSALERVGRPLAEAYRHYPDLVRRCQAAMQGKDQTFSMSDGVRAFDFYVRGLRDGDRHHGVIGIIVEVTEQRRAAAAVLEAQWRSRFVAEINHELRTPLTAMLGFAELLGSPECGPLTERQRRYLDNIRQGGGHLLELINELLDMSKLRAGHIAVARERVDIAALFAEVVETMHPIAEGKGVELRVGHRSPWDAAGDRRRILQVLMNLVSNALKFTPAGGRVTVSSYQRGGTMNLEVADSGVGIALRDQERIFDDFVQLPNADPATLPGTGLGLPLSRRLITAMSGQLKVRSSIGRGSTFVVSLPAWR